MRKLKYILFVSYLLIQSCIEDPDIFANSQIGNETSNDLIIKIYNNDSSFVIINDTLGRGGYFPFVEHTENLIINTSSVEIINYTTNEEIVYYNSEVNNDNYQEYFDRTPFRIENWKDMGGSTYHYYIYNSDFD